MDLINGKWRSTYNILYLYVCWLTSINLNCIIVCCFYFCFISICDLLELFSFFSVDIILFTYVFLFSYISSFLLLFINITYMIIYVYSIYYMFFDISLHRFLIYLFLFILNMNWFVLAYDTITILIGWECLGFMSFLLISYWFYRIITLKSASKAFLIGKCGDLCFCIFFLSLYKDFISGGSLYFISFYLYDFLIIYIITIPLVFCAISKSTQFGTHIWLPDAMEGPIPVSATCFAPRWIL